MVLEKIRESWDSLISDEKHRVLKRLLQEIDYSGETGALGLTINEKGIAGLYDELFGGK